MKTLYDMGFGKFFPGDIHMTNEAFDREKQYYTMICISKKLLGKGLISEEELSEIEKALSEKYHPSFRIKLT